MFILRTSQIGFYNSCFYIYKQKWNIIWSPVLFCEKNNFFKKIFEAIPKVEKAWVSSKWEKSGQGNIKISRSQRKVFYYLVMTFQNNEKLKFSNDLQ